MEEIEFNGSYLVHTENYPSEPFELVMGDLYNGNQQLTNEEAKSIADFIYKKLGLIK